nr:hypothetical protein [Solirubrobacterales bacterium]
LVPTATVTLPPPSATPLPSGPCADTQLRCPNLIVGTPSELKLWRTPTGRALLGSRNKLINRGTGPLTLLGDRDGGNKRSMAVRQRIASASGTHGEFALLDTHFDFWRIPTGPGQGSFWKLRDGLRFELWTADENDDLFVARGIKTRFCMRDLRKVVGLPGPSFRQFGACNQSLKAQSVQMGISSGWMESYPAGYYEQYVDVSGLSGCYSLRHIADPLEHVFESDESDNVSRRRVRLPVRRDGRIRSC